MIVRIWFCNWSCCSHTRAGARQAATNWPDAEHGAPSSMGKGSHDPPLPGLAWLQAGLMCLFHGQIAKFQRHHALFFAGTATNVCRLLATHKFLVYMFFENKILVYLNLTV